MQVLYTIGIYIISIGAHIAALFNTKIRAAVIGRKQTLKKIKAVVGKSSKEWIWIHCSSLGEFEQGRPVIEALKEKYPKHKIALSFFSPSGYEVRKNYPLADLVFYLPWDTPQNAKHLAQVFNPKLWILVKYDYWYNHLKAFSKTGTSIIVISSIFRENQIYFKPKGKWFIKNLKKYLTHFFVQNKSSKKLLKTVGISNVNIAGDTRFDRVQKIANSLKRLKWVEEFKSNKKLIVVGSSWNEDEELWIQWIKEKQPKKWKIIIAPHQITRQNIENLKSKIPSRVTTFTEKDNLENSEVLILDTIGILNKVYAYADIAYVGGGFNKSGVHNTLEPAVFGIPIIIGPNYAKFNEVRALKKAKALFPIHNYNSFSKELKHLTHRDLSIFKPRSKKVFEENLGATDKIINWIENSKIL